MDKEVNQAPPPRCRRTDPGMARRARRRRRRRSGAGPAGHREGFRRRLLAPARARSRPGRARGGDRREPRVGRPRALRAVPPGQGVHRRCGGRRDLPGGRDRAGPRDLRLRVQVPARAGGGDLSRRHPRGALGPAARAGARRPPRAPTAGLLARGLHGRCGRQRLVPGGQRPARDDGQQPAPQGRRSGRNRLPAAVRPDRPGSRRAGARVILSDPAVGYRSQGAVGPALRNLPSGQGVGYGLPERHRHARLHELSDQPRLRLLRLRVQPDADGEAASDRERRGVRALPDRGRPGLRLGSPSSPGDWCFARGGRSRTCSCIST